MGFQQKSKIQQERVRIFTSSDSKHVQQKLSCTSNIKIIQKVFVYLLPAMFDIGGQPLPLVCLKCSVIHGKRSSTDLRNNPLRSQLAPTHIKHRKDQTTQIVHKKRHVFTIRYFRKSLKICTFALWFQPIFENVREGKALREIPLRSLETDAIFVFLIQQCFTGNKVNPDPLILQ